MLIDAVQLLEKSPLGILICDQSGRNLSCNALFLQQTGLESSEVVGNLYVSLPFEAVDNNGEVVQLFTNSNETIRFQHWQENPLSTPEYTIHYLILERQTNQKVAKLSNTSLKLSLPKRANWLDFLDYEVSRSRRYDNPLSILKLHCLIFDNPEKLSPESIHQLINQTLMDELRWADMIGHTEQGSYLMVLPETPIEAVTRLQEKLNLAINRQFEIEHQHLDFRLVFADANWRKNDDSKRLLKRARSNLVKQLETLLASAEK